MSSSSQVGESWISSFCGLLGHEYFAEVSEDFIEDDFNLTGLQSQVPMYKEALEMILDVEPDEEDDEDDEEDEEDEDDLLGEDRTHLAYRRSERRHNRLPSDISMIESSAELLYGLIHQRYITSRPGIQQMLEKYELVHFGNCPRVYCNGCKVLPVGLNDTPGVETVKLFCPSCLDVYTPPNSRFQTVDGAFFGTTFGCLFFMTFPELEIGRQGTSMTSSNQLASSSDQHPETINGVAPSNLAPGLGPGNIYEPRIYGFRVSERARSGPRMQWLRDRPTDVIELDEVRMQEEQWLGDDESQLANEDVNGEVDASDQQMLDAGEGALLNGNNRKKISSRRRKSTAGANGPNVNGAASPMETNGLGDVG